jgi:hypothetical protein
MKRLVALAALAALLFAGALEGRAADAPVKKLTLTQAVDGTGSGQLFDTSAATPKAIGALAWDTDGVGTVTLTSGVATGKDGTFKVRLF